MIHFTGSNMRFWLFFAIYAVGPILTMLLVFKPKELCLSRMQIFVLTVLLFFYCLIGARIAHIILHYDKYMGRPINRIWQSAGASSYGAYAFAWLTVFMYSKITRKSFLEIFDYFTLCLAPLIFFVRIGCLTLGCCYGRISTLPWAMVFYSSEAGNLARHPTQAYEMTYALAIFIVALRFYHQLKNMRGATSFSMFFAYFFMRFFNEFLRVDSPYVLGPLKLSHVGMMIAMFLCGIGIYYSVFKKGRKQEFLNLLPKMIQTFIFSLMIFGCVILSLLTIFF